MAELALWPAVEAGLWAKEKREVPPAKYDKKCKSCSLYDFCMPQTGELKMKKYIRELYESDEETS